MYVCMYIYIYLLLHASTESLSIVCMLSIFRIRLILVVSELYLDSNVASTIAVYTYLATSIDKCIVDTMPFYVSTLCKLVPHVCFHTAGNAGAIVELNPGGGRIHISRDQQVTGFKGCMDQGADVGIYQRLKAVP